MLEGHVHHNLAVAQLSVSGKQGQLHVLDCAELGVLFVVGVHKMLNLTHLELSDAQQPGPRCDLIAEAQTQLSGGEGHLASVELEQPPEVDEDALGGLGPQVGLGGRVAERTHAGLEHEVELPRGREGAGDARGWGGDQRYLLRSRLCGVFEFERLGVPLDVGFLHECLDELLGVGLVVVAVEHRYVPKQLAALQLHPRKVELIRSVSHLRLLAVDHWV
mmetsp:Transcript_35851/g.103107  ORF Transcript_35851/g.103107 Transcript_35851/m.103107 type:complete len:219 (+) Transcript_35851:826-1482(+)